MKKYLSILLVLGLSMTLLASCGAKTEGTEVEKETETEKKQSEDNKDKDDKDKDGETPALDIPEFENMEVLTVENEKVMKNEANVYLLNMKQYFEQFYGPTIWVNEVQEGKTFTDMAKEDLKKMLIRVKVLGLVGKEKNLKLSKEDEKAAADSAESIIKNLPKEFIGYYGFDQENFEKVMKDQKMIELVFEELMKDYQIDEAKVNEKIKEDKTYQEIEKYGVEHYFDKVKVRHILIKTIDDKTNQPLDEEKKKEAKAKAEELLKKAKAGEDFAELAKENSQDPGSAANGGEIIVEREEGRRMVPEFEKASYEVKEGEISDLVETMYGYHIIKVDEKTPANEEKIEQAKQMQKEIRESIIQNQKLEAFEDVYNGLKDDYKTEVNQEAWDTLDFAYVVPIAADESDEKAPEKKQQGEQSDKSE